MSSLLENFAGKIKLIYIDPPFDVGADFTLEVEIGDTALAKLSSPLEEVAYRDTWSRGLESYLSMMRLRLSLIRELLAEDGMLWVHMDWHAGHYVKLLLDEIFGKERFLNEIVRVYAGGGQSKDFFPRKHDPIFVYTKSDRWTFNEDDVRVPYDSDYKATVFAREGSRAAGKTYKPNEKGKIPEDWWLFNRPYGEEIVGYPTQKPEALLERVIRVASNPGDIVADFFSGSGTTVAVAEKLGRRWIGADLGRFAIHTIRKRLLSIEQCRPFEVLNLGKYERQFWSSANFGEDLDGDGQVNLLEYIAFILKAFGAEPFAGSALLHGKKGDAYIHVGSVSSPVTIADIELAAEECKQLKGKKLHVLGWEWEMGLHDPVVSRAKRDLGIDLALRQIPNEVMEAEAVKKGQVKFFDLAYVEVEVEPKGKSGEFVCKLKDFSTPNTDLVPEEVRKQITKWSDYVDYWAVDWNFQNDTFNHDFVDFRTRQDRSLKLKSDPHTYEKPGTYQVLVKVIDIFGNDTSTIVELKVK
jgi:DNA modification methylase